jgi:hypothetical protein
MIGGQAVIEGVMMRGPHDTAMAVRRTDGTINLEKWQNTSLRDRYPIFRAPVLRGVISFFEMLVYGYKSLMRSAEMSGLDDGDNEPDSKQAASAAVPAAAPADATETAPDGVIQANAGGPADAGGHSDTAGHDESAAPRPRRRPRRIKKPKKAPPRATKRSR